MTRSQQVKPSDKKRGSVKIVQRDRALATKKKSKKNEDGSAAPVVAKTKIAGPLKLEGMRGVRKATLRRLLLKGGMLHVSKTAYVPLRTAMYAFTKTFVKNAHVFAANGGRKTIMAMDVIESLDVLDRRFYGQEASK